MKIYKNVEIQKLDNTYRTSGLKRIIDREIEILIKDRAPDKYIRVLTYIIDFFVSETPLVHSEQTISYYSWILKFVDTSKGSYSLWEAESSGNDYIEGVDYAIKILDDQMNECSKHNTAPIFPMFNQNIVISKGVYEGLPIEGMRYKSPSHMTGWWLITDMYDDNIESVMNVHYFHVAFKRPDILKYLSLPNGFRFQTGDRNDEVWYDKMLLEDETGQGV